MPMSLKFWFGKNWTNYVENALDDGSLDEARQSMLNCLPSDEYRGHTFLDVGCGSGIFSLTASRLGCTKVVSFDADANSVAATRSVKDRYQHLVPPGCDWQIFEGSILDASVLDARADIVYSWGVLHHTGEMWKAIGNAASMVHPGGWLILAIYNRAPYSESWRRFKRFFNLCPGLVQRLIVLLAIAWRHTGEAYVFLVSTLKGLPRSRFRQGRGMTLRYDAIDWLGGYPYEYASFDEVKTFVESLGFSLSKTITRMEATATDEYRRHSKLTTKLFNGYAYLTNSTGNNEFVFQKCGG